MYRYLFVFSNVIKCMVCFMYMYVYVLYFLVIYLYVYICICLLVYLVIDRNFKFSDIMLI